MDEDVSLQAQEDLFDLNTVMQAFGVHEWRNLGLSATATPENFSLLLEIEGKQYTLSERGAGFVDEDAGHLYAFRQFLSQAGIPLPPLWLTPTGEPVVAVDDIQFELQAVPPGAVFSTADPHSVAWVAAAGTMLARFHQASRDYRGPIHRWPSEAHIGGVVQGYLNLARGKAENSEIAALAAALSNWCDHWEAMLPAAMVSIGAVRGLPEFHIHGDYQPQNLRFGSDGVTAVLNLSASRWEKRIIELAYALFYFSALEWLPEHTLTRPLVKRGLDPERAHHFLAAYGAIYPPAPQERTALGDALVLVAPIATINGPLEDVFFSPQGINETLIEDVMNRLAWASSFPGWLARVRRSLVEMW